MIDPSLSGNVRSVLVCDGTFYNALGKTVLWVTEKSDWKCKKGTVS